MLCNSSGFKDFRVKSMKAAHIGRKEIELALQGGGSQSIVGGPLNWLHVSVLSVITHVHRIHVIHVL